MIHLLIDVCSIDLLPIERSPEYQQLVTTHGETAAKEFTFEVTVPPFGDDG
jgi:hypothetical protein